MMATCMAVILRSAAWLARLVGSMPSRSLTPQLYGFLYTVVNIQLRRANIVTDASPPLAVGAQVRRWRLERGRTLAALAASSGVNTGYLSQIENDKASPSLATLAAIGRALDVPPAWFLMTDSEPPLIVRAADRPVRDADGASTAFIDGRASRDISIIEVTGPPGGAIGAHSHPGDEHHLVLSGRFRGRHGGHEVEVGPGDYLRWDGAVPHDGEVVGDEPLRMLIIRIRPTRD
jgi:transcriptional regulator with XRE-family HTH domain